MNRVAGRLDFSVSRPSFAFGFAMAIGVRAERGPEVTHVARIEFVPYEVGEAVSRDDLLQFDDEAAQRLFDELWRLGLRPQRAVDEAAKGAAMQAHIDDLRALLKPASEAVTRIALAGLDRPSTSGPPDAAGDLIARMGALDRRLGELLERTLPR